MILSFCAEVFFGVADITGSFVAGLAVSGLRRNEYVVSRFNTLSYMLLSPIFFANIGLAMTLKGLNGKLVLFMVLLMIVALISKVVGCGLGAKIMRYTNSDCYHGCIYHNHHPDSAEVCISEAEYPTFSRTAGTHSEERIGRCSRIMDHENTHSD